MLLLHLSFVTKYFHDSVRTVINKLAKGNVLDVGCGSKPFKRDIQSQIKSYTGIDLNINQYSRLDVQSIAGVLPFKKNSFDFIIFTQVIEHLEDPSAALDEAHRVLRNSGILILAWPFLYPIHEYPRDFYRYTDMAIQYLSKKSGFTVEEITPISGFWITYFSFLSIYLSRKSKRLYTLFIPVLLIFKYLCIFLEKLDRKSKHKWAWGYYAILKKEA